MRTCIVSGMLPGILLLYRLIVGRSISASQCDNADLYLRQAFPKVRGPYCIFYRWAGLHDDGSYGYGIEGKAYLP